MSEVKRYFTECGYGCSHGSYEHPQGQWVDYEDYARLKAEVERLRASSFVTAVPVEQYERLVKAGDALADAMDRNGCHDNGDYDENVRVTNDWNAVKEGKQP